ncbi:hypothetical protein BHF72_1563 [Cloacibacterium normanense]|uniref:Uncharacterized protein n=1 Tax=Cloacibacterium normanense TaxID=237258 RepID=A0A1E5UH77_9FLAO|nr:hypothetical protein BHF72_1563 [Cloacibacterium normanense]
MSYKNLKNIKLKTSELSEVFFIVNQFYQLPLLLFLFIPN